MIFGSASAVVMFFLEEEVFFESMNLEGRCRRARALSGKSTSPCGEFPDVSASTSPDAQRCQS
jgi:hypothetical protein